ncbi:MAG TPA: M48 family metallopeptidase, partial [Thermoanaerobaculia bacterium]|nr:M48 family metallopeptidase [Thermoanaerobaculia bacterium]
MRTLLRIGLAVAAVITVAAIVSSASAQPKLSPAEEKKRDEKRVEIRVTDEMVRHSRLGNVIYFVSVAYSIAVLILILGAGWSRRMREFSERVLRRPYLASILFVALFTLLDVLLEFPLTFYSGYIVPHQFNLTDQKLPAWLWDQTKGLLIGLALSVALVPLVLLAMRRMRRWWFWVWLASIPLIIFFIIVVPIFIDPVFNKFVPLRDEVLKQRLLDLASKAGIEGSRVYEVDKSKQTKEMNAYVTGLGPTKRIVLWDTILAKMNHDELVAVMGHEMGHYVLKHIWKGLAFSLAVSFFVLLLGQKFYERGLGRWGIRGPGDPASWPWFLVVVSVMGFILTPVLAGESRWAEHQADVFSLELTQDNVAMASAFVKLTEDSKQDPYPHPFIEFWRYSHPSIGRRVQFALSYKPWEKGEPNQLWKGSAASVAAPTPAPAPPPVAAKTACAGAADRLCPADRAADDPSFVAYRERLLRALDGNDTATLRELVDAKVRTSFGDGGGFDDAAKNSA